MESHAEIKVGRHKKNRQIDPQGDCGIALHLRIDHYQRSRYMQCVSLSWLFNDSVIIECSI
jgi:hypothetical protein